MKIASLADVKAKLSEYVRASGQSPVVITRSGKAVAAIIPLAEDEDLERLMLGYSPRLRSILAAARARMRQGQGIPHERFWRQLSASPGAKRKR
jgi:prevent-host-death family protein